MIRLEKINACYGKSPVLREVTLRVPPGKIVALLGRNGVGKTTTLQTILNLTPRQSGRIYFKGQEISHLPDYQIPRLGIGYVPQESHMFPGLTVAENLRLAVVRGHPNPRALERIYRIFPKLPQLLTRQAHSLSGGEQRMLSIARGLLPEPQLLLLDEPTEGLMPLLVKELTRIIQQLQKEFGMSILLVEQKIQMALAVSDEVYLMEKGEIRYRGTPAELTDNPGPLRQYLGV